MTTVGYGDVVPITRNEKIFAILTMMLSSWAFAFVLGSIGGLISQSAEREAAIRSQTRGVNRFLLKYQVCKSLQSRVRRYLQYRFEEERSKHYDEKALLKSLSASLRKEIYDYVHGAILESVPVFAKLEANFISNLAKYLATGSYSPGDVILTQGEMTTELYFIQKGSVEIVFNTSSVRVLEGKENFGEIGFFLKQPRCTSARSVLFVELMLIKRSDFLKTIEIYPAIKQELEENVFSRRGNVLISLGLHCYQCGELGHIASQCSIMLLSLGQAEHRQRWLDQRKPRTKYISGSIEPMSELHRNPYRRVKLKPTFRSIRGIPNLSPERIFPQTPRLHPLMDNFCLTTSARKKELGTRILSNFGEEDESTSKEVCRRRVTFVFDSDSNNAAESEEERRLPAFRYDLLRSFKEDPILDMERFESPKNPLFEETDRSTQRLVQEESELFVRTGRLPTSFMT